MSESVAANKNKRLLITLVAVFVIPVILAKFALEYEWFNKGSTNKGQLLEPALDFAPLNATKSNKWRIVYLMPESCGETCENALFSINQIRVALGREMDRVESVVVWTDSSDSQKVATLGEQENINLLMSDVQNVNNVFKHVATDGIFITDTLDNVILKYPLYQEKQQAVMHSRDILADLKKLLKLSRIG